MAGERYRWERRERCTGLGRYAWEFIVLGPDSGEVCTTADHAHAEKITRLLNQDERGWR